MRAASWAMMVALSAGESSWREAYEAAVVYRCEGETVRTRKAWSAHTAREKALWISSVQMLMDAGHYSTFVGIHLYNSDLIHDTAFFFPWHRVFLWEFENALRATAPEHACVTLPVWDWASAISAREAANVTATAPWTLFDEFLTDMGGGGDVVEDYDLPSAKNSDGLLLGNDTALERAVDGTIKSMLMGDCEPQDAHGELGLLPAPFEKFPEHTKSCNFSLRFVTCECASHFDAPLVSRQAKSGFGFKKLANDVEQLAWRIVTSPEYTHFHIGFMQPHGSIHKHIGGHYNVSTGAMRSNISPSDPVFWGHHAYVDGIHDVWMRSRRCKGKAYIDYDPASLPADGDASGTCLDWIYQCEICSIQKLPLFVNSCIGLFQDIFTDYDDSIDAAMNYMPFDFEPVAQLIREPLVQPPGVTNKTWKGTWTPREVVNLQFWGAYTYNYSTLPLMDIVEQLGLRGLELDAGRSLPQFSFAFFQVSLFLLFAFFIVLPARKRRTKSPAPFLDSDESSPLLA
mmetsp:Transcript_20998/g.65948  ORF Transcript_20998/g.65948 Transcript_20998/m.65948 type:complete len:514 (+) Transcript_20998:42-1583(+)